MLMTKIIGVDKELMDMDLAIGDEAPTQVIVLSAILECGEIVRKRLSKVAGVKMTVEDCTMATLGGDLVKTPILKSGQEVAQEYTFKGEKVITMYTPQYRGRDRAVLRYEVH